MNKKLNIEEIKELLPDYITGSLSWEEAALVQDTIKTNTEIAELYADMKGALEFVGSVKFEEPVPQYWNNLLPRIHERIEAKEDKKLFKNPIPLLWKILVPVAAIILIAIIYKLSVSPENQITQDKTKNTQQEKIEVPDNKTQNEKKQVDVSKIEDKAKDNLNKSTPVKKSRVLKNEDKIQINDEHNLAQKENNIEEQELNLLKEFRAEEFNDLSDISEVDANTQDEELENEIEKLSSADKSALLDEISNSNL